MKPDDVESTEHPRPGRDDRARQRCGVPHVYGDTRADVEFGAGYAGAADRLFLMDVLRHTGRAQLSSFVGGAPATARWTAPSGRSRPTRRRTCSGRSTWRRGSTARSAAGSSNDLGEYVAGINAYIAEATSDPTKLPAEYAALGKLPSPGRAPT